MWIPNLIAFLVASAISVNAYAEGSSVRGGGSYVVIDGKVTLADPYYAGVPISQTSKMTRLSYNELPKELRAYLDQTEFFLKMIHVLNDNHELFKEWVRSSEKHYVLVPKDRENNVPCDRYLPVLNRPVDDHFQYGCTFGPDTFLFVDKWKQAPIDVQAFAILHERLWAYKETADQSDIANFVSWSYVLERRYISQISQGDRSPVPANEIAGFDELQSAAYNLDLMYLRDPKYRYRMVSGGAVTTQECASRLQIDQAFLGLGTSVVGSCSGGLTIQKSTILRSNLSLDGPDSSEIVGSWVDSSDLTDDNSGDLALGLHIADNSLTSSIIKASRIASSKLSASKVVRAQLDHVTLTDTYLAASERSKPSLWFSASYAEFDRTDITSDQALILGTSDSVTKIQNTKIPQISKLEVTRGAALNNVYGSMKTLTIGQNSSLDSVSFFGSDRTNRYFSVVIENNTSIRRGKLVFELKCGHGDDVFAIGIPGKSYQEDLKGSRVVLTSSSESCRASLPNSDGKTPEFLDNKRFDGQYTLVPRSPGGDVSSQNCSKSFIVQALNEPEVEHPRILMFSADVDISPIGHLFYPIQDQYLDAARSSGHVLDDDTYDFSSCNGVLDCLGDAVFGPGPIKKINVRNGEDFVSVQNKSSHEAYFNTQEESFDSLRKLSQDTVLFHAESKQYWSDGSLDRQSETNCVYQKVKSTL